jgi:hypothetical protein
MKVTVDVSANDLKDILRFSGEKKGGAGISKLVRAGLMLGRRRELSDEVLAGRFRVCFPDWESSRRREREGSR